jgi:hypothetical protein
MSKPSETLQEKLDEVWADLRSGALKRADADSFANLAGKKINLYKADIEYQHLRKTKNIDPINFGE